MEKQGYAQPQGLFQLGGLPIDIKNVRDLETLS